MKELDQYHKNKMSDIMLNTWCRSAENFCLHCQHRTSKVNDLGDGKLTIAESFIFNFDNVEYDSLNGKYKDGDDSIEAEFIYPTIDEGIRDWLSIKIVGYEGEISMQISLPQRVSQDGELSALRLVNEQNKSHDSCSVHLEENGAFLVSSSISFVGYYNEDGDMDSPRAQYEATMNLLASLLSRANELNDAVTLLISS